MSSKTFFLMTSCLLGMNLSLVPCSFAQTDFGFPEDPAVVESVDPSAPNQQTAPNGVLDAGRAVQAPQAHGPNCGCGQHGAVGAVQHAGTRLRHEWNRARADFNLTRERNTVWPQPFKCRDRSLYYQTLQVSVDAGWEYACTLTDIHFDDDNKLNQAGEAKIAWFIQAAPQHRRQLLVYEENPVNIDTRLAEVRSVVDRWYRHLGSTLVEATRVYPQHSDGQYYEIIDASYRESRPAPVLTSQMGQSIQSGN